MVVMVVVVKTTTVRSDTYIPTAVSAGLDRLLPRRKGRPGLPLALALGSPVIELPD